MMTMFWIIVIIIWHCVGLNVIDKLKDLVPQYDCSDCFDDKPLVFLNPSWVYKHCNVNYFGVVLIIAFAFSLCPIVATIYWLVCGIKFLMTVGKKE